MTRRTRPDAAGAKAAVAAAGGQRGSVWGPRGTARRVTWITLLAVGLSAGLSSVVMFGPSDRKNAFTAAGDATAVAVVAGQIAVPALLAALLIRVVHARAVAGGEVLVTLTGILCGVLVTFRLAIGGDDSRGFSSEQVREWAPYGVLIVLLMAAIAIRCEVMRRTER